MRTLFWFLLVLFFTVAFLASAGLLMALSGVKQDTSVASVCALLMTPFFGLIVLWGALNAQARRRFYAFVEHQGGSKYKGFADFTGLAINAERQLLLLASGRTMKAYPFNAVRSWEKKEQRAGRVIGGGMEGAAVNLAEGINAANNTGIFVQVKDVDTPEWHIRFHKKREINRWFEILQQLLNESGA